MQAEELKFHANVVLLTIKQSNNMPSQPERGAGETKRLTKKTSFDIDIELYKMFQHQVVDSGMTKRELIEEFIREGIERIERMKAERAGAAENLAKSIRKPKRTEKGGSTPSVKT
jgi:predicted DNA-binding protein